MPLHNFPMDKTKKTDSVSEGGAVENTSDEISLQNMFSLFVYRVKHTSTMQTCHFTSKCLI